MSFADALLGSISIAVLVCIGGLVLNRSGLATWRMAWAARLALAHMAGSAIVAWLATVIAVAFHRLSLLAVYAAIALIAASSLRGATFAGGEKMPDPPSADMWRDWWTYLCLATIAAGMLAAILPLAASPLFSNDAYTDWMLKSKAIFLQESFQPIQWGCCLKPNYPMLVPLQSWWVYRHVGYLNDRWSQIVGLLFYLDLVVLVFAACRGAGRSSWAWMATALVAGNGTFTYLVPSAQADLEISAYFVGSAVFLVKYFAHSSAIARSVALLMLLGALQTKNEGEVWAIVAIWVMFAYEIRWKEYRSAVSTIAIFLLAAAPWFLFKHRLGLGDGPEELMATTAILEQQWAIRLHLIVGTQLTLWHDISALTLILSLLLAARSWRMLSKRVLALIGLQFAAYQVIYFIVLDPGYQLKFAVRSLGQIAPALLCISLMAYHSARDQPSFSENAVPYI